MASLPPGNDNAPKRGAPAYIAAAVALSAVVTGAYEGLRTKPYRDPAGILTVCYGETERQMKTYTAGQCKSLLIDRESVNYAPAVAKCVPAFKDEKHRYAFAASIDAAYNAGIGAFCRSRMARSFNAGQWKQGCGGFPGWRATANGRVLAGLERRRVAEYQLCRGDL